MGRTPLSLEFNAARIEQYEVETRSLDELCLTSPFLWPSIVKIDVEGAESLVLDGARALLLSDRRPVIIVETGDRLADRLGESASTVLSRLFDCGYRIFNVPDWEGTLKETQLADVSGELRNYLALPDSHAALKRALAWRL